MKKGITEWFKPQIWAQYTVNKPEKGKNKNKLWIVPGTKSIIVYKIGREKACKTSLDVK